MLTTDEVARRLGVKPATIYAYVSRGLLVSRRNADGKGSLFAEPDVEAFAAARRRTTAPGDSPAVHTAITLIKDGVLYFRGHNASTLATEASYESVATLLWTGESPERAAADFSGSVPGRAAAGLSGSVAGRAAAGFSGDGPGRAVAGSAGGVSERGVAGFPEGVLGRGVAGSPEGVPERGVAGPPKGVPGRGVAGSSGDVPGRGVADSPGDVSERGTAGFPESGLGGEASAGGGDNPVGAGVDRSRGRLVPSLELLALAEAVTAPLPAAARLTDRLRVIVAAAAAADPLRFDTAAAAVIATGRTMLATMVAALPLRRLTDPPRDERFPLASVLWPRLTADEPTPEGIAALNAAMVLLADHDLAASTLAARVAASTRAHPYAVVGAGLAALDGPLHGAASGLAYGLLEEAVRTGDPMGAISSRLRAGGPIPGFGHHLYPGGDPRAAALLALLRKAPTGPADATIDQVAKAVTQRSGLLPNVDFALASFALHNAMDAEAGEAIFAIARTAGWIAHALEEYADRPSRFRPSGRYAGRQPTF